MSKIWSIYIFSKFAVLIKSPFYIFRNVYSHKHLLMQMVLQELKGKFAGSFGGILWHFFQPLIMIFVYMFVFIAVFKLRIGEDNSSSLSALYIIAGLFPWLIFSEGIIKSISVLFENSNLIKKTAFPIELLVVKSVMVPFISYGIAVFAISVYSLVNGQFINIIELPLALLLQFIFTLGLAFLLTAFSVFFKDLVQFVNVIISFGIYLVPILFPMAMLPLWSQKLMVYNPVYPMINMYHHIFVYNKLADLNVIMSLSIWSLMFIFLGSFIFFKLKDEFADWL